MTDEEKMISLQSAGAALFGASQSNSPDKLMLKLKARDAIEAAITGTALERISDTIKNDIAPLCEPFGELQFCRMAALAGAIAGCRESLADRYKLALLISDFGS